MNKIVALTLTASIRLLVPIFIIAFIISLFVH